MVLECSEFLAKNDKFKNTSSSGHYDPDGVYMPPGTWFDARRAYPGQLSKREAYLLKAFQDGTMVEDDKLEWQLLDEKKFYPPRGHLQKHWSEWSKYELENLKGKVEA